jgi:hypothetical protein
MKKFIVLLVVFAIALMTFTTAFAHNAGPCNDSDGDGSPSGYEYAKHHIVPLAQDGALGNDGHKPGTHQGFSACNPSGK